MRKQGATLLTTRGWLDGHVVEVRAQRRDPTSMQWTWNLSSITTGDSLAHGRLTGDAWAMMDVLFDIMGGDRGDNA